MLGAAPCNAHKAWTASDRSRVSAAGARLAGNFAPVAVECDADHLRVTGRLPRELNGTLYRNGPNPRFPAADAHWFVGDGMIHAFTLEDGRARLYYWCHEFKVWRHAFTLLNEESAVSVGEHMIRNRLEQR